MHALAVEQTLQWVERPVPVKQRGEELVKVRLAGICNTDLEIVKGYMNFTGILGHEFVGEIIDGPRGGQRVVGEINIGCGRCAFCMQDLERHCPSRSVLGILNKDGAFAEYLTLPSRNLYIVPDAVPDEAAVFAEPLAAALEILEQYPLMPAAQCAVIGDGKLGFIIAQVLKQTGAQVSILGKHERKLQLFRAAGMKVRDDEAPCNRIFDLVVECSGNPTGMLKALSLVKPRGAVCLKSTYHGAVELDTAPIVIDEITVLGSRCGRIEPALRLLEEGHIQYECLIEDIMPLEQGLHAFKKAQQSGCLKILLKNP